MGGIALNEDCDHYFITRAGQKLDAEAVASWVDQYAGTQITELVMNANGMRASYDSEVWDSIWTGFDPELGNDQARLISSPESDFGFGLLSTAWELHKAGLDLYKLWIDRAREKGISPWISMRMNDVHNVDDEQHFLHSEFWRANPQLRRVQYKSQTWPDKAFDYGQPAVRDYHLKLVRELIDRYDFDGLELDWMRFGYHFAPGNEEESAAILTQFTTDVRQLLDAKEHERGHRIKLSARVPAKPNTALWLGMDAAEWARRGLVDKIVPTPFWTTIDNDIPLEIWKRLLAGTDVTIAAGLELYLRPHVRVMVKNTLETIRGSAVSSLYRGADQIYLFNYMDSDTTIDDADEYRAMMREIGDINTMIKKPRRHVLTYADTQALGEPEACALPARCDKDEWRAFRIHIGPKPNMGRVIVLLGIENDVSEVEKRLLVRLNGRLCAFAGVADMGQPHPSFPAYTFDVDLDCVSNGYNIIDVCASDTVVLGWVEIAVDPRA